MDFGSLNVTPPSLDETKKIGDWTYLPLCALNLKRVQVT